MKRVVISIAAFCTLTAGIAALASGIGSLLTSVTGGALPSLLDMSLMPVGLASWVAGIFLSSQR